MTYTFKAVMCKIDVSIDAAKRRMALLTHDARKHLMFCAGRDFDEAVDSWTFEYLSEEEKLTTAIIPYDERHARMLDEFGWAVDCVYDAYFGIREDCGSFELSGSEYVITGGMSEHCEPTNAFFSFLLISLSKLTEGDEADDQTWLSLLKTNWPTGPEVYKESENRNTDD
jgi:hypothetical protein